MSGALDSAFKDAAKAVVKDLGTSLDSTINYIRKTTPTYNVSTGTLSVSDTDFLLIKAPIEFIASSEEEGAEERRAKVYITPDLINGNQPTLQDTLTFVFAGVTCEAEIVDIRTYKGGQEYLYVLSVIF